MRALALMALTLLLAGCGDDATTSPATDGPTTSPPPQERLCVDDRYRPTPCEGDATATRQGGSLSPSAEKAKTA